MKVLIVLISLLFAVNVSAHHEGLILSAPTLSLFGYWFYALLLSGLFSVFSYFKLN
jgi:hypothetical protein